MADEGAAEPEVRCDYCGAEPGPGWLGIETYRDDGGSLPDMRIDYVYLGFCSTDHAGRYLLEGQLPPPDFSEGKPPPPRTWRRRLQDWAVAALIVMVPLLAIIGIVAIVQWIRT